MRRMLDPTKVGGGRHCYRILMYNSLYYLIYSAKDYDFNVGVKTSIKDFYGNEDYKELRASGSYPAGGYYIHTDNTLIVPTEVKLKPNTDMFDIIGVDVRTNTQADVTSFLAICNISVIKLS